ncbi:MAG: RNA polymerase factor sigma-54, partial [Bacteroidota bacterium]
IAEFLIGNIDDDGYLQCEPQETAAIFSVAAEVVVNLLQLIQTFDPVGIGAHSLEECLLLQLRFKKEYTNGKIKFSEETIDRAERIILDHLHDLADGKLNKISHHLKSSIQDILSAVDLIKSLDPKPGRNFVKRSEIPYVIPDVIIRREGTGYLILVNETEHTRITINPLYRQFQSAKVNFDPAAVEFIKTKYHSASWLIKCIEQRRLTLYKIADSLLKLEHDFFESGPRFLKPLTLRDLALATGLHESTISRATKAKFIDTPWGVYSFKYFFSSKLESPDESFVSAEVVKSLIKKAIKSESATTPLSDQQLAMLLQKEHQIRISRRTIAKYREEMLIPASGKRKNR